MSAVCLHFKTFWYFYQVISLSITLFVYIWKRFAKCKQTSISPSNLGMPLKILNRVMVQNNLQIFHNENDVLFTSKTFCKYFTMKMKSLFTFQNVLQVFHNENKEFVYISKRFGISPSNLGMPQQGQIENLMTTS